MTPNEIFGLNNQVYIEEQYFLNFKYRPSFDPEKYKKPAPFYGFSHDKYLISSNNPLSNQNQIENKRVLKTGLKSSIHPLNGIYQGTVGNMQKSDNTKK